MVVVWSLGLGFRFVVICLFDLDDFGMIFCCEFAGVASGDFLL